MQCGTDKKKEEPEVYEAPVSSGCKLHYPSIQESDGEKRMTVSVLNSLTKDITPKIYRVCVCVLINKRSFEPFMCVNLYRAGNLLAPLHCESGLQDKTLLLSRRKYAYRDTTFVGTKLCLSRRNISVATKLLSRQTYFCRDKMHALSRQMILVAAPASDSLYQFLPAAVEFGV